jgi:hypothetical protein
MRSVVILLGLLLTWGALASVATKSIHEMASSATDVAVVEITDRVALEFEFKGERRICGYRVEARVIESLKGAVGNVEFVDPLEGEPDETSNRYLLFAFVQPNEARQAEREESLTESESRCFVSAGTRVVTTKPRSLLRIVVDGETQRANVVIPAYSQLDLESFGLSEEALRRGGFVPLDEIRAQITKTLDPTRSDQDQVIEPD